MIIVRNNKFMVFNLRKSIYKIETFIYMNNILLCSIHITNTKLETQ